ncbi:hypothetical protein [Parasitella parasitica]|uniref:Uncharacterized protein n=1 Tax=Parasitella parasitica TaxID=35722 RepID=A0A0B7N3Y9_9FUNG|nr:hypothetical protein [Parasitella parasitica]
MVRKSFSISLLLFAISVASDKIQVFGPLTVNDQHLTLLLPNYCYQLPINDAPDLTITNGDRELNVTVYSASNCEGSLIGVVGSNNGVAKFLAGTAKSFRYDKK